jgi:hypothetical protein
VDLTILQALALVLGPTGGAWLAVKTSLNGARADIASTRTDVGEIRKTLGEHGERLATIEAKRNP